LCLVKKQLLDYLVLLGLEVAQIAQEHVVHAGIVVEALILVWLDSRFGKHRCLIDAIESIVVVVNGTCWRNRCY